MSRVVKYNVWAQIEGVDKHDDVLEGDSYREPRLLGEFKREKDAEALLDRIDDMIEGVGEPAEVFLNRWYHALGVLLDWISGTSGQDTYRNGAVDTFATILAAELVGRRECILAPSVLEVIKTLELDIGNRPRSEAWYEQRLHRLYKRSLAKGKVVKPVSRRETGKAAVS